ncbi:hypothetical protein BX283_2624 [Streptomyces sp. TLI_146]|nr:hypothetical protein BX283_2624 [Streptomyces sp. TLI_146]
MVHRARTTKDGNAVPVYIPRDVDPDVRAALSRMSGSGGVVLLVGDSTAGKTRCAYEAMRATLSDHLLIAPRHITDLPEAISKAVRAARSDERCVLWLNDIEKYLGPGSFDLKDLHTLRTTQTVVLGTIRSRIRKDLPDEELVRLAQEFEVERLWSAGEVDRARKQFRSDRDERLRLAISQAADFGIAETLATGPQLWRELRGASVVNGNPRGAALVWCAIDLALAGLTEPLSVGLLGELHEDYLPGSNKQLIGPEPFEAALSWATSPRDAVTRLLIPEGDGLRPFDYLLDAHLQDRGPSPKLIPEKVWATVLASGTERHQRFSIALAAHANDRMDIGRKALLPLAEAQDAEAQRTLGVLCEHTDRQEAARWLQRAIDSGDVLSFRLMGNLHFRNQDRETASQWYRKAAEAGDEVAQSYYNEPTLIRPPKAQTPHLIEPDVGAAADADWDEAEDYGPTPRTLRVLEAAFVISADMAYDSLEEIGDQRVDLTHNYAAVFSDLPVLTWGQNAKWRRQMARCFDDLAQDIRSGEWPQPTCTGEEMAMHIALERASAMVADEPELVDMFTEGLPEEAGDYDWGLCLGLFLEDTDVLFLYEPWAQGIEEPDNPIHRHLGIANLEADDWFDPFRENETRDPERGFRRCTAIPPG